MDRKGSIFLGDGFLPQAARPLLAKVGLGGGERQVRLH